MAFQIAEYENTGLGAVRVQVIIPLDDQYAHGLNGFGDAIGEASETAVLLERDLNIGIVVNQSLFPFRIG